MIQSGADGRVASPCISVCRIDDASGLCAGCLRTLDEIAVWSALDDDERRAVWVELAARAARVAAQAEQSDAQR
jgi:predicted Fe-S protein YdhL (DUF1289 family)